MDSATVTSLNGTEYRAIVDTHRHPMGAKMQAKMAEAGLYDPKQGFPQTNAQDLICYREYAMPKQREEGAIRAIAVTGRHRNRLGAALADHLLDNGPTVLFERVCVGH